MYTRSLGKTGIEVSEIGFGAWAIGGDAWGPVDDEQSLRAMEAAVEQGVNFIDTADVYGNGRSEKLVAKLIQGRREKLVISTKGGLMGHHRDPNGAPVYDKPDKVIEAFENSLKRLETDYIDVYFCHLWWDKHEETEAFLGAFERLKRDGKVRAVGVSTENLDYIKHFNRDGGLDAVQLDYSILNRSTEREVLPYLHQHGIGAVVRGPLRMGILTGKFQKGTEFAEGDIRKNWPKEAWFSKSLSQVEKLKPLADENRTLSQAALRFVLSHPAVSTAIPGAKTAQQAALNVSASVRPLLSEHDMSLINQV
ncbi:aldo/keto reductase [Paenibacillus spongiae]|uniref:Aldo/keto reductase n=1 Tax=Paenibacillus spongiae TaxID=2909671 RepID=A0ABY5SLA9_9BACL|nr:aldo/keto reductase [Paenibacillus spongiae]UVI33300.1 aldo/keto reductase [Paenibacillus spongiae]